MDGEASPKVSRWLDALERSAEQRPALADLYEFFGEFIQCLYTVPPPATPVTTWSDEEVRTYAEGGFPLLKPDKDVPIDAPWCQNRAQELLELLWNRSPDDENLRRLAEELQSGRIELDTLWSAALARNGEAIKAFANKEELPVGLVFLLAGACVRPLIEARAAQISPVPRRDLWREPYCPVCGDGPAVSEIDDEGRRHFLCASCSTSWMGYRVQCPFCGTRDHEQLHYFTVEDDPGLRVDCCRVCKSYLKTLDRREGAVAEDMWLADMTTVHLDLVGQREGYRRPAPSFVGLVLAAVGVGPVPEPWAPPGVSPSEEDA